MQLPLMTQGVHVSATGVSQVGVLAHSLDGSSPRVLSWTVVKVPARAMTLEAALSMEGAKYN